MIKNYLKAHGKYVFINGIIAGLLIALVGASLGLLWSKLFSPEGWGGLLYAMRGAVWGYGVGVALGAFKAHRNNGGKCSLSRAFYSTMSALLAVIFLAGPLRLQIFLPLMWGALILFPPFVAALFLYERTGE